DHRVPRRHDEVLHLPRTSDERQPIGRARPEAAPELEELEALAALDALECLPPEGVHSTAVDRQVHAGELEGAAEAEKLAHRSQREAALGGEERDGRRAGWTAIREAVALGRRDRDSEAEGPPQAR